MGKLNDWLQRRLGGHVSLGPVTVYGFNAMHVAINIWTKRWGVICFHPDLRFLGKYAPWMLGKEWPWYFYLSPNHTPWSATFAIGPGVEREEKIDAVRRWAMWGHNYDWDQHNPQTEAEFFWNYVQEAERVKQFRESEAAGKCGCCGTTLTHVESTHSNVCLKCLLEQMERVAQQIRAQEAPLQDPNPEQHQDPEQEGWN